MKRLLKGAIAIGFLLYPFLVGYSILNGQLMWVSGLLLVLGLCRLLAPNNNLLWPLATFSILCGGLSLLLRDQAWLKLYPVLMSVGALIIFASTLLRPPSMIERFARIHQPDLPASGVIWTRKVTMVWCGFFALNALIALGTVLLDNLKLWMLYNGFISYLLMSALLGAEFLLRRRQQRKHPVSNQ